jgi:hypothetical protein
MLTVPMHADMILSENFDELTANTSVTTLGTFTALNGTNIDVVNQTSFGLCAAPASGNCVDLGGTSGKALGDIGLVTSLNLAAGTYELSFDLLGSERGQATSTTVSFGSATETFNQMSSDVNIVDMMLTTAGGPTQIEFLNNGIAGGNNDIGALLDNVLVSTVVPVNPGEVPEPGTLGLLATGLLAAAGVLRRQFVK